MQVGWTSGAFVGNDSLFPMRWGLSNILTPPKIKLEKLSFLVLECLLTTSMEICVIYFLFWNVVLGNLKSLFQEKKKKIESNVGSFELVQ